jgi:hypothetical protein
MTHKSVQVHFKIPRQAGKQSLAANPVEENYEMTRVRKT